MALLLEAPLSLAVDRPQRAQAEYEPHADVLEVVLRRDLRATATVAFQDLILAHVATAPEGLLVSSLTFIGFRAMRDSLRAQVSEPEPTYEAAVGLLRSLACRPVELKEPPDWPSAAHQSPVASFLVSEPRPAVIQGLLLIDESHRGGHIAHHVSPRLVAIAGESGGIVGLLARGTLLTDSSIGLEKAALEDLLDLIYGSFFPKEEPLAPLEQKVRRWAMERILSPLFVVLGQLPGAPQG